MEKLFAVYIGGVVEGCHVELHDVRFAVGASIEDCYDDLRAQWWGVPESLHIDAWGPIEWTDGYRVEVVERSAAGGVKLYLANLGGYDPKQFTELHENFFVAAADPREAKKRALAKISGWTSPHRDAILEVETVVDIAAAPGVRQRFIKLTPDGHARPFAFEARYVPIGKMLA